MRAVRIVDGQPRVLDVEEPSGDGVVVTVAAAGICGSDLSMIDAGWAPAVTMGHEIAGWAPDGTPVAIEPNDPCGACDPCRSGLGHLCEIGATTMIGIGADGGWAERVVVPAHCLVRLPGGIDVRDALLVEPLAVAVHGIGLLERVPDRVAVVGAGTIGLAAAAVLRAGGAAVDVAGRHDHQRAAAEALGAGTHPNGGYDLVVETAGTASGLRDAVRLARAGATVLLLSVHWTPTPTPGLPMWLKEVRLVTSMTYGTGPAGREIDEAARILANAPHVARAIISHRVPLDGAPDALDLARDRAAGAIKVVLEPVPG